MDSDEYFKIPILSLNDDLIAVELDLYIKLPNNKVLKIANKGESKKPIVEKYLKKNVNFLYLDKKQFHFFTKNFSSSLDISENAKNKKSIKEQAQELNELNIGYQTLKSLFEHKAINQTSIDVAKKITKRALGIVQEGNTLKHLQTFKKECVQEFMRSIITAHLACFVLDYFKWSSESIKEKVVLGSILCDITLSQDDFKKLKAHQGLPSELPENIRNHPFDVVQLLSKQSGLVEADTLIMIEQHHEIPGRQGFPKGLHHSRISPLTAVFIVVNYFVEQLMAVDFSEDQKKERIENTYSVIPSKFEYGHLKKAADALYKVLMTDELPSNI